MPSIHNLRKQAKLFLRWHRERYYPVAVQATKIFENKLLGIPFKLQPFAIGLYYNPIPNAVPHRVMNVTTMGVIPPLLGWNAYEWDLRS